MGGGPLFKVEHLNFPELQTEATCLSAAVRPQGFQQNKHHLILTVSFTCTFLSLRLERG